MMQKLRCSMEQLPRSILHREWHGQIFRIKDSITSICAKRFENLNCCDNHKCVLSGATTIDVPPFAVEFCDAFSNAFAVADEDGFISLFNTNCTDKLSPILRQRLHQNAIFDISWVPNSYTLATASGDQTAKLWDFNNGKCVKTFKGHTCSLKTICVSKFDKDILATGSRDGNTLIWDTRLDQPTIRIQGTHVILDSLTPMRKRRRLLPNASGQLGKDSKQTVTSVVFQDKNTVITAGAMDGSLKIWDLRKTYTSASSVVKQSPLEVISYPGQSQRRRGYTCITINKAGSEIYASCTDDVIYKFNLMNKSKIINSRQPISRMYGHYNTSFYVRSCLSNDENFLLSGSDDNCAYIWRTDNLIETPVVKLCASEMEEVTATAWSPVDPFTMVTCSDECAVRMWHLPVETNVVTDGYAVVPSVILKPPLQFKPVLEAKSPLGAGKKQVNITSFNMTPPNKQKEWNKENTPTKQQSPAQSKTKTTKDTPDPFPSPVPTRNLKMKKMTPVSMDKWVIRTPPLKTDLSRSSTSLKKNCKTEDLKRKCRAVKRLDISMSGSPKTSKTAFYKRTPTKPLNTIEDYFKLSPNK